MNNNSKFEKMLSMHKKKFQLEFNKLVNELNNRAKKHDCDKIDDPIINSTYKKHFPILKEIPFGSQEYRDYSLKNMYTAQSIHAKNNRHHFYDSRNKINDVNLIDLLEAIIDIKISQEQYDEFNVQKYIDVLKKKGIMEYKIEELIENTINFLDDK